jgi:hypothetical protein
MFRLKMQIPWSFRVLGLDRPPGKRAVRRAAMLARGFPNPILKARKYEEAVARGVGSYRHVARTFGVTREEVCQYLTLLRSLPPELVRALENETRPEVLRQHSLLART